MGHPIVLILDDPVWRTYLVRVNPKGVDLHDPVTQDDHFESLWLVETCIGDDVLTPWSKVREQIAPLTEVKEQDQHLSADLHLWSVVTHPKTPYGMGWKCGDGMVVIYHGRQYSRDSSGAMTRLPGRADEWPTADQWRVNTFRARLWARRKGLLP